MSKPAVGPTPMFDEIVTELGELDLSPAPSYEHCVHLAEQTADGDES